MIRFFLDTPVFKEIAGQNVNILILHNQKSIANIINKYPNTREARYPRFHRTPYIYKIFSNIVNIPDLTRRYSSTGYVGFHNLFLGKPGRITFIKRLIMVPLIILVDVLYFIPIFGRYIFRKALTDENYIAFLKENQIDGIIVTCPPLVEDRILAQAANQLRLPVIMGVDGWDTLTNFGYISDYKSVLVWGPEMAKHAKEIGFPEDQIIYTGIPYKDKIIASYNNSDKQETRKKYGIKANEKVILIFGGSWYAIGESEKITINAILNAIESGELAKNTRILFRMFPRGIRGREEEYYESNFKNNPYIHFQHPNPNFKEQNPGETIDANLFHEIGEIFSISDVVINVLSMSLLEGSIVGLPGIICNYEDQYYPTKYVTRGQIYKNLIENGIFEVKNTRELICTINTILLKQPGNSNNGHLLRDWDFREENVGEHIVRNLEGEEFA